MIAEKTIFFSNAQDAKGSGFSCLILIHDNDDSTNSFLLGVVDGGLIKGYKAEVEEARGLRFYFTFFSDYFCAF